MKERSLVTLQSASPSGAANAELNVDVSIYLGFLPVKIIAWSQIIGHC